MKNKEMLWDGNGFKIHPSIKVIGQVYISDYSQLENAVGQRPLTPRGVKQLTDSMSAFGICSCPIVVKEKNKYVVIDGWHRISVARKNSLDIICTLVDPDCTINKLMIILNTTQQNWSKEAYLNNGIEHHENDNYIKLKEIWRETGLSLSTLTEVYSHNYSKDPVKKMFEEGSWSMTTEALGNRVVRYVDKMGKYVPFAHKNHFIRGFSCCVAKKGFNFEHFLSQVKKYPKKVVDPGDNDKRARDFVNLIYNHCCLEEEQVYLA